VASKNLDALRKSRFAHDLRHVEINRFMTKGERISRMVGQILGEAVDPNQEQIETHPFYRAYFRCWNQQDYYEAHDVLEQLWLQKEAIGSPDATFLKGLIQAAGAFVHLRKNFEHPAHPKHSRRLRPAVKLFDLAEKNLAPFAPRHHWLDVLSLLDLLRSTREKIVTSDFKTNPWSPQSAPKLHLL
jgi:predicted metal-dependent hydrolase